MRAWRIISVVALFAGCGSGDKDAPVASVLPIATLAPAARPAQLQSADAFDGVPPAPAGDACQPVANGHCFLPFPSNWFSRRDASSATGMRVTVPPGIIGKQLLDGLPNGYLPDQLLNEAEGFSVGGPILFELSSPPDPATLPSDGGNDSFDLVVGVFDMATGEKLPIRADVSLFAGGLGSPKSVLEVFPRSRFDFGHHYVAVLTDRLRPPAGNDAYARPNLWSGQSSAGESGAAVAYHEPLLKFAEGHGIPRGHVLSITDFTVRSEADVTGRMLRMMRTAYSQEHPVRNLRTTGSIYPDVGATVEGDVRLTNFRTADGDIDDSDQTGHENWVPFVLTIPSSASSRPAKVAIYGHPLTQDRNFVGLVATANAQNGYATVAIDWPNHGARSGPDGGYIAFIANPKDVGRVVGMLAQGPVDQVSLLKAVRSSLSSIDAVPRDFWGHSGDGKPDLDLSTIVFEGTSLGGVLGSAFLGGAGALGLGLQGAYLQVSGSGMVNTLAHSALWTGLFDNLLPRGLDGAQALFALAVVGQRIDLGDALPIVHRATAPLLLTYGLDDSVVPNCTSLALAELTNTPVMNDVLRGSDVGFLPYIGLGAPKNTPKNGRGLLQLRIKRTGLVPLDLETHLTFLDSSASDALKAWLPQF